MKYYIIYKPYLCLSRFTGEPGKRSLADFFDFPKCVYPVGRLDYDSEGLMIITNDKSLNDMLLNPENNHSRTYMAQVEGIIHSEAIAMLKNSVEINLKSGKKIVRAIEAKSIEGEPELPPRNPPIRFRKNIPTSWTEIVLVEGKNRQVRKMTAAAGFPTLRLVRTKIEELSIGNLNPSGYFEINKNKLYKLLSI